ncbi:hypothetical protein ANCCAN_03731 [Ancylostoma caninum]|uniref:Uncharacterized protein n=1 Tax=Ancylostoma caninum TaxID=29170 RepID=A0A368H0L3_ANCCA|nr:hypothetical protein ANCCAN_03731 [Ancylostoma caninum]
MVATFEGFECGNVSTFQQQQQHQQQALQLQQAALAAAAASGNPVLPPTGLAPSAASLPFPANAALGPQLAGAALLGRPIVPQPPPSLAPRKPGRWCGMHVKIAHDIAAYRQSQQQKDKQIAVAAAAAEQRARVAAAAPPSVAAVASTSQATSSVTADATSAAAQIAMQHAAMAARGAAPQPPHCLPSTSSAAPTGFPSLAGLPPQALQTLALSNNPQMLSALQEARRVAAATPKPPQPQMTPQRPPSAMPRTPQQPAGLGLPPGLASLGPAAQREREQRELQAQQQQQAQLQQQQAAQLARSQSASNLPPGLSGATGHMLLNPAQLLQLQMAQAQAQQQQAAQAQAAQQQQTGAVDPREALLRLYSQSSAAAAGRARIVRINHVEVVQMQLIPPHLLARAPKRS